MKMFTQTSHTDTDSVAHTRGARFDCTRQGIHCCFYESMGKCTPTTFGHGCCLRNRVRVDAHPPRRSATDVAFATEYGWMHTRHDVRPRMLPSQQSTGGCTPATTFGHGCCLRNRVRVDAHPPRRSATDVAFATEYGWMHTRHDVRATQYG